MIKLSDVIMEHNNIQVRQLRAERQIKRAQRAPKIALVLKTKIQTVIFFIFIIVNIFGFLF